MIVAPTGNVRSSVGINPRLLPPPVVIQGCLPGVAGLAQASEVVEVVGAAVFEREDVVDFLHWCVETSFEAVLAERVGGDVGGADLTPPRPVAAVDLWITLILPILGVLCLGVGVAEAVVSEFGAAGVGAWGGWFGWHRSCSLQSLVGMGWPRAPSHGLWWRGLVWWLDLHFNHLHHLKPKSLKSYPVFYTLTRSYWAG